MYIVFGNLIDINVDRAIKRTINKIIDINIDDDNKKAQWEWGKNRIVNEDEEKILYTLYFNRGFLLNALLKDICYIAEDLFSDKFFAIAGSISFHEKLIKYAEKRDEYILGKNLPDNLKCECFKEEISNEDSFKHFIQFLLVLIVEINSFTIENLKGNELSKYKKDMLISIAYNYLEIICDLIDDNKYFVDEYFENCHDIIQWVSTFNKDIHYGNPVTFELFQEQPFGNCGDHIAAVKALLTNTSRYLSNDFIFYRSK
jgi:hypothetical protein